MSYVSPPVTHTHPQAAFSPEKTTLVESFSDPDLAICSHAHQVLVSIADEPLSTPIFHYWNLAHAHPSSAPSLAIPTQLSLNNVQSIRGYRDLGTFLLPATEVSTIAQRHKYLSSLAADRGDQEPISRIIERLRCIYVPSQGISVRLFTIQVLGNAANSLFVGGPVPVWKWAKPDSTYGRQSGFWETEVSRAIVDGEWAAGKTLLLLVQGVSEERKEELMHRRVKFPAQDPT